MDRTNRNWLKATSSLGTCIQLYNNVGTANYFFNLGEIVANLNGSIKLALEIVETRGGALLLNQMTCNIVSNIFGIEFLLGPFPLSFFSALKFLCSSLKRRMPMPRRSSRLSWGMRWRYEEASKVLPPKILFLDLFFSTYKCWWCWRRIPSRSNRGRRWKSTFTYILVLQLTSRVICMQN